MMVLHLLVALAAAAVPLRLPPGEDPELWAAPLAAAGLIVGPADDGAWVHVTATDEGWELRVQDEAGRQQASVMSIPTTVSSREDLAWLAVSLLRPVPTIPVSLPVLPAVAEPEPAAPAPRAHRAPSPQPELVAPIAPLADASDADQEAVPPQVPPQRSPEEKGPTPIDLGAIDTIARTLVPAAAPLQTEPPSLWLQARSGMQVRRGTATGPLLEGSGGFSPLPALLLGGSVGYSPMMELVELGGGRSVSTVDVTAVAEVTGAGLALRAGLGVSRRTYSDAGRAISAHGVPMVSVDTGLVAKIRGGLSVQPGVRIQQDLAPTLFRVDGEPAGELTQTALSITVALRIDTRRSPKGPLGIDEGSIAAHQDTNGS